MTEREAEIRTLAYHFWEQEGRPEGHAVDYWLRAESEWETHHRKGPVDRRTGAYTPKRAAGTPLLSRARTERSY